MLMSRYLNHQLRYGNHSKLSGFVLFTTLIFLQIFSMLSLYGMTTSRLLLKAETQRWEKIKTVNMTKILLRQIEDSLLIELPACLVSPTTSQALIKQPIAWWQQVACSGILARNQYYYVVEFLGKDACGMMNAVTRISAQYYRITLYFQPHHAWGANILLQSTLAKESDEFSSCTQQLHKVSPGEQMWRELI